MQAIIDSFYNDLRRAQSDAADPIMAGHHWQHLCLRVSTIRHQQKAGNLVLSNADESVLAYIEQSRAFVNGVMAGHHLNHLSLLAPSRKQSAAV
jgi:hypothetical protein